MNWPSSRSRSHSIYQPQPQVAETVSDSSPSYTQKFVLTLIPIPGPPYPYPPPDIAIRNHFLDITLIKNTLYHTSAEFCILFSALFQIVAQEVQLIGQSPDSETSPGPGNKRKFKQVTVTASQWYEHLRLLEPDSNGKTKRDTIYTRAVADSAHLRSSLLETITHDTSERSVDLVSRRIFPLPLVLHVY